MTKQNYRVWAAAALGLCVLGALALLAWLWLDVHTTGFVPIALQSALRADYSADPRSTPLPALNLDIIEQVIADQPTATPAPTGATRVPGSPTPTLIPITVLLQTPVPSVTPILLPGQPSPTPHPTETPQPTPTPSAVIVPSVTPEASATTPGNATATPTVIAGATSTLVNVASRTPVVSVPSATTRPPTATIEIAPTATLPLPPTNTRAPTAIPPTNTRVPTAVPPSNTPVLPPSDTPAPPATNTPNAYPPPPTSPPATGYP